MSSVEAQISTGLPQGQELWLQQSREVQCGTKVFLEEVPISPTIAPPKRQSPNWKKKLYQRSSHMLEKFYCLQQIPIQGSCKGLITPREFDFESVGFDYGISTGLEKSLGGHKQNLVPTRNQEKETEIPQETEPDLAVVCQESLAAAWVNSGLPWYQH